MEERTLLAGKEETLLAGLRTNIFLWLSCYSMHTNSHQEMVSIRLTLTSLLSPIEVFDQRNGIACIMGRSAQKTMTAHPALLVIISEDALLYS